MYVQVSSKKSGRPNPAGAALLRHLLTTVPTTYCVLLLGGAAALHSRLGSRGRGHRLARFLRRGRPRLQRRLTAAAAPPAWLRAWVRARRRARAARRGGALRAGAARRGTTARVGHWPRGAKGPPCRRPGGVDRRASAGRRSASSKRM